MGEVLLKLTDFVENVKVYDYNLIKIRDNLVIMLAGGRYFVFQIVKIPGKPNDEYILTNDMELENVFKSNKELVQRMKKNRLQLPIADETNKNSVKENFLSYKGVTYHYAFEFKISLASGDRIFNVVISDYRAKTKDFSGMCLENEYKVVSNNKILFEAFFEIIKEIVDCIIFIDKKNTENPKNIRSPLMVVKDKKFLDKFEECKKSEKSMEYYCKLTEKLKTYIEKPETLQKNIKKETKKIDIIESPKMVIVLQKIRSKIPQIKDIKAYRLSA